MKEYCLRGQITLDDYVQMNRFHMKKSLFTKKTVILLLICVILVFLLISYTYYTSDAFRFRIEYLLVLIVAAVYIFIIRQPKSFYKKNFEKNKLIQEQKTIIINETAITEKSEHTMAVLTKDAIDRIEFDKDSVYIYTAPNMLLIIKERFAENLEEFNEIKTLIKQNFIK